MPLSNRFAAPALVGFAAALLCATPAQATNGAKPTAYGARAAGRGGVDYAYADDGIGPANNPAGMAFTWGNRFDNNWAIIFPTVKWSNSFGSFDNEQKVFFPAPAYSLGLVFDPAKEWEIAPLFDLGNWGLRDSEEEPQAQDPPDDGAAFEPTEEELYGSRWKVGFGVFPVTGGKIKMADMRTSAFARPVDWETDVMSLAITPSLAFRITRFLSVGVSLQVLYSQFELDGGIAQPLSSLQDTFEISSIFLDAKQLYTIADVDDAKTDSENNNGSWGLSGRIGLMFQSRFLSLGVVYQERGHTTDYFGRALVDGEDQIATLTSNLGGPAALALLDPSIDPNAPFVGNYDMRIQDVHFPRMVGVGLSVRPAPWLSLGLDYTFIHWSDAFRQFKARLYNGDSQNLDALVGTTIRVRVPLRWRDQHVIALGASALLHEGQDIVEGVPSWSLVWRAGYNYAKSPTPKSTTTPQQPTISEHHLSTGFTVQVGPLMELTTAVEWALPNKINTNTHRGDLTLSDSEQEVSLLFVYLGLGVNF